MAITRPYWVMAGWIILAVVMGLGASQLAFRGDFRVYFEPDNPQLTDFERMQSVFSKSENVSYLVVPESGSVFNPQTFNLLVELTDLAWQTPMSSRAESLVNYQHTYAEFDDLIVEDLISGTDLSPNEINRVAEIALSAPELNNRLVSKDGAAAVVEVTVNLPDGDQTATVAEIAAYARSVVRQIEQSHPQHKVYLSGVVMMNNAFAEEAQKDATSLVPLMFVVIALSILVLTRSIVASIATMLVVFVSVIITMGFAGHAGFFLSTATVNVPTIVTTLAIADCLHVIVGIRQGLGQGMSREEAIKYSLGINIRPIFITSATTAAGFLTLNFSAVPILADLGNLTAIGVMVACAMSLTLTPVFFRLFTIKYVPAASKSEGAINGLCNWVVFRHRRILPYSFIVMAVSIAYMFNNELNDIVVKYFDHGNELRQAVDAQERYFGGMSNIDFVITTDSTSGLNRPEVLIQVDAFSKWLRTQPEVKHVFSITDVYKRLNKNIHNDDAQQYVLPDNQDEAAQYLLLYEMSLPYGLDVNNQVDIDKSATRVVATLDNLGSREFTEFEVRAKQWFTQVNSEVKIFAASPALMFAHIGEMNMRSMVYGAITAMLMISALLVVALRSWKIGVVSLLPNLIPAAIGFGIWGMISGEINLGLSVVLSMTMGIIVDDTVHFLSKYQVAREQRKSVEESVHYAFRTVGKALVTTTLVLAAGFGVLTLSSFALNADMGLLTVIIIVAALIVDLLFLPAFLLRVDKNANDEETAHAS